MRVQLEKTRFGTGALSASGASWDMTPCCGVS